MRTSGLGSNIGDHFGAASGEPVVVLRGLSPAEHVVAAQVGRGFGNRAIAAVLGRSRPAGNLWSPVRWWVRSRRRLHALGPGLSAADLTRQPRDTLWSHDVRHRFHS